MCGFLRSFLRACQSTCKFAWHQSVFLPPLVLRRMGGQIRRFSPSANLSHKWLVICRNYCVEFSLFISAPYTRAHHWDFALFAFTTFTERDQKRWSFLRKCPTFFLFFLRRFLKNVGRFLWASSHVFESWLQFADNQGALNVTFSFFFCRKNASFQHSCVKVVKAKKRKSLGTRPRVTCAREKVIFLKVKSYPLQMCFTEGKGLQISLPSLEYFKPQNHDDCFLMKQYDQV